MSPEYAKFLLTFRFSLHINLQKSNVLSNGCRLQKNDDVCGDFVCLYFLVAVGYFLIKNLAFDLFDEVYGEGFSLLFKNNGKIVSIHAGQNRIWRRIEFSTD